MVQPKKPPLPWITDNLSSPRPTARRNAIKNLATYYPEQLPLHLPYLISLLTDDPSAPVRQNIAALLNTRDDAQSEQDLHLTEAFLACLQDKNAQMRLLAARFLAKQGHPRALEALLRLLKHKDWGIRARATRLLPAFTDERVVFALLEMLNDSEESVQSAAIKELGKVGTSWQAEQVAGALLKFLRGRPTSPDEDDLIADTLYVNLANTLGALARVTTFEVRRQLVAVLRDQALKNTIRRVAASALAIARQPDVSALLIDILKDRTLDAQARRFAAHVFVYMRDGGAVGPLIDLLKDADASVRGTAAQALGASGDRRALAPLHDLLADTDAYQEGYFVPARFQWQSVKDVAADALQRAEGQVR